MCGHSTSGFLGKVRASLMLIYVEFETIECFGLLINGGFVAMEFILWMFCLFWCVAEIYAR